MNEADRQRQMRVELTRLWAQVEPAVSAFVFSAVPGFQDAEDVVQRIALEVARRFDEYDPARSFEAWVIWLAKSRIIDHYRSRDRDRHVFDEQMLDRLGQMQMERVGRSDPRREALAACMSELSDRSRRLLDLRYVGNLSPTKIADAIGTTATTVRVSLFRLRNALAECIGRRVAREERR